MFQKKNTEYLNFMYLFQYALTLSNHELKKLLLQKEHEFNSLRKLLGHINTFPYDSFTCCL